MRREKENRLVLGRIATLAAPRVVLLPARALAAHHVRPRATLAGVVNRLVHVEHDAVLRRRLDHLAVVAHRELRVVRVSAAQRVRDVARLERIDAERAIQREGAVQLPLVVLDPARRLVMRDELHALLPGVAASSRRSKSGYGCVNEKAFRLAIQSPSQPTFHPSTSTPPIPLAAAKSM